MNKCKYCNSENLILEPRVQGQNIMTADMVALKCGDCGKWLKWCPKEERKLYFKNSVSKNLEEKERYEFDNYGDYEFIHDRESEAPLCDNLYSVEKLLNQQDKEIKRLTEEVNVGEFWHSAYKGKQLEYDQVYAELRKSYDENQLLKQQLKDNDKQVRKHICDEIRHKYNYVLYDDTYEFDEITGRQIPTSIMFPYCLTDEDLEELEQGNNEIEKK